MPLRSSSNHKTVYRWIFRQLMVQETKPALRGATNRENREIPFSVPVYIFLSNDTSRNLSVYSASSHETVRVPADFPPVDGTLYRKSNQLFKTQQGQQRHTTFCSVTPFFVERHYLVFETCPSALPRENSHKRYIPVQQDTHNGINQQNQTSQV